VKNKSQYSYNTSIRFITLILAVFFTVLGVADGYNDDINQLQNEELVSEQELEISLSISSLTRLSNSKVAKFQRIEFIKIIDKIFSINTVILFELFNSPEIESFKSHFISFFFKSDILKNAP
jgi:hypothetical protein